MFFGSGMFGQLPQKQEVAPIQGYQTQVAPGSGQVLTGSIPQSVDQSLVPYANQQATGVGSANTFGMPQGMPGVGSGATPPYVPQSQQAPSQQPQQAPTAAPVTIEGTVEEAGTTGDPMVDGAIQQGMTPAVIPLRKPMSTNRKLSALGMMMSAAGTDSFTRVAGTVQAGLAQDEASVEKYNRDLIAATKPTVTTEYRNDQYVKVTTPPSYKLSADGQSIEFVGPQSPTIERIEGGDLRDPDNADHAGGATGWREDEFIADYQAMTPADQIAYAEEVGISGRPLNDFELKTIFQKNSAGLRGSFKRAEKGAELDTENMTTKFIALRDSVEYIGDDLADIDAQIKRLETSPDRGGIFQPIEQFANQVLAEFGSKDALKEATNEQILQSQAIQNMMGWFREQGLGARGLDTPAEFRAWLNATGGNLSMTNDAALHFLRKRREGMLRSIDRYNGALSNPAYRNVENIGEYQPLPDYRSRYNKDESETPEPPPGAVRDGQ